MTKNEMELWSALRKADAMMLAAKEHPVYTETEEFLRVLDENKNILYKYSQLTK